MSKVLNGLKYTLIFVGLIVIDYILGNGLVEICLKLLCKITCFVKKTIRKEEVLAKMTGNENNISMPKLFLEILMLWGTIVILNSYKKYRGKDRIDDLLKESNESLRQTNEFLEKWRLRKINWQVPNKYSYLDEEPQEIKPLKIEVPILHMAIIDTLGTTRSQPESGDAGDTISFTDTTLLSMTSILDYDGVEPIDDLPSEEAMVERNIDYNCRQLWDVMEEDDSGSVNI